MLIAATDIAGIAWPLAVVAVITIGIGAAVQATIGLGMAVLAAPILAIIDPDFLPVTTIVMVMPLSFAVARREHEHIVWSAAGIALFGRLPGVAIGALLISSTGSGTVKLLVGISVLLAVAASATRFHVTTSTRNLLIAGMASGFSGTTAGIGGPPLAVAYQHEQPATTRATLAVFFGLGSIISFSGLAAVGEVNQRHISLCLLLLPGVLVGLALSRPVISRFPENRLRIALLTTCSFSAIFLLIETAIEMLG
ncbi:MAG TPA: hypothetical protein DCY63_06530 [Acidimicrobiaceae bacterium]|nr:hypothetical protein [Acidimicrobiaceae bacterium]